MFHSWFGTLKPRGIVLGVGALDNGIALCIFPLLLRRNAYGTENLQGAQPKDWEKFDSYS